MQVASHFSNDSLDTCQQKEDSSRAKTSKVFCWSGLWVKPVAYAYPEIFVFEIPPASGISNNPTVTSINSWPPIFTTIH